MRWGSDELMKYECEECGREISRAELEESDKIRCPDCDSYRIRKVEE